MSNYWGERQRRNEESHAMAEHHREPWTADELEFLLEFFKEAKGDPEEEQEVAAALGRSIEACRQRYYDTVAGRKPGAGFKRETTTTTKTTTTTTTTTERYIGAADDPDDQWWSPDYYTQGR